MMSWLVQPRREPRPENVSQANATLYLPNDRPGKVSFHYVHIEVRSFDPNFANRTISGIEARGHGACASSNESQWGKS